jgi:hypothetical protein
VDKELAVTMQEQKEIKAENEKISKQHEKVTPSPLLSNTITVTL